MLLERLRTEHTASERSATLAVDRLPAVLDELGVEHGISAAKAAADRGEPVLLLATWSGYGLALLDELLAAGERPPVVIDMAVFTSPAECREAWPLLADVVTLPAVVTPAGVVAGLTGARDVLRSSDRREPPQLAVAGGTVAPSPVAAATPAA